MSTTLTPELQLSTAIEAVMVCKGLLKYVPDPKTISDLVDAQKAPGSFIRDRKGIQPNTLCHEIVSVDRLLQVSPEWADESLYSLLLTIDGSWALWMRSPLKLQEDRGEAYGHTFNLVSPKQLREILQVNPTLLGSMVEQLQRMCAAALQEYTKRCGEFRDATSLLAEIGRGLQPTEPTETLAA